MFDESTRVGGMMFDLGEDVDAQIQRICASLVKKSGKSSARRMKLPGPASKPRRPKKSRNVKPCGCYATLTPLVADAR